MKPIARTVAAVVAATVLAPMIALYAYLLLWYSPEVTYRGPCAPQDRRCGDATGAYLWIGLCVLTVAAAGTLGLAWWLRRRSARWWPWPLAAAVLVAAGLPVADLL